MLSGHSKLVVLATCLSFFACTRSKVVAKIGDREISSRDVEYRDKVIRFYYPQETRSLGLKQLTEAYIGAQILANYGRPITEKVLDDEVARIDKNTKMPAALEEVKAIFGKDTEAYRKIYVLPVYVNRVIRFELFSGDKRIQGESLRRAKEFVSRALAGNFRKEGEASGGKFVEFEVSRDEITWKGEGASVKPPPGPGDLPGKLLEDRKAAEAAEASLWVDQIVKTLKPGSVYSDVIDKGEKWLAVRYVKPVKGKKDRYALEGVFFPKENYSAWLEKERAKVTVQSF